MGIVSKLALGMLQQVGYWLRSGKVAYLRLAGVRIGKNTLISMGSRIDTTSSDIVIGDRAVITYGCVVLAHDYGAATKLGKKPSRTPCVWIGDNVFIGVNSVILPNVHIGANSIIGAGSVVTKDIPANVVALGNPARVVRTIGENAATVAAQGGK